MKTIREIADEIGVSKQAVSYRLKRIQTDKETAKRNGVLVVKENGILVVSLVAEMLIKQAFSESTTKTTTKRTAKEPSKEPPKETIVFGGEIIKLLQENIEVFKGEIKLLKEQLEAKDRQIEEKDRQIDKLTETVQVQAQSINFDRKNELAETLVEGKQKLIVGEGEPKKRSVFGFLRK